MKAFGCLVVGLLWNIDVYYWAYVQSGLYVVSLICTLLMIIASVCVKMFGNDKGYDESIVSSSSANDSEYETKR